MKRGNCYVTSEALYHLLGGKKNWKIKRLRHENDTHWYLVDRLTGLILDATVSQFKKTPDYSKGISCGFLTKKPSKRAKELMKVLVWQ